MQQEVVGRLELTQAEWDDLGQRIRTAVQVALRNRAAPGVSLRMAVLVIDPGLVQPVVKRAVRRGDTSLIRL